MKNLLNSFSLSLVIFLITTSVYAAPSISIQPVNKTVCAGSNTFFSVVASSPCTINYQWQVYNGSVWSNLTNTSIYTGATSDTLKLSPITTTFIGSIYRCNITTATCDSVKTDSVKLTVNSIPVITTEPVDGVYSSDYSMLNIAATGGTLNYQWQIGNYNLNATGPASNLYNQGINSDTLFIHLDSWYCAPYCGGYEAGKYRCFVSNGCGADTSQTAYSFINYIKWKGITNSSWNDTSNWENKDLYCYNWGTTSFHYSLSSTSAVPAGLRIYISPGANYSPIIVGKVSIDYVFIPFGKTLSMNSNSDTIILAAISSLSTGIYNGSKGTTYMVTPSNEPYPWNALPSGTYYRIYFSSSVVDYASFYGAGTTIIKNNITSGVHITLGGDLIIDTNATYNIASIFTQHSGRFIVRNVGGANRTGAVLFPLASTSALHSLNAPLSITNTGTPDEFRVRVIDSVTNSYPGNIPVGLKLNNNVVGKTWFIEKGLSGGGANVSITFSWDSVSEKSGFTRNNSYVSGYTGAGWIPGTAFSSILSGGLYTKTISGISSFGPFGIGSNGTLPVELISFEGKVFSGSALLGWETSVEINNSCFIVQRSTDNVNFTIAGKVAGHINSNSVNDYCFEDKNAGNYFKQNLTLYYRLKQVDLDGSSSYSSKTIALEPQKNIDIEAVFEPNPFTETSSLRIKTIERTGTIKISVTDISGKQLIKKDFAFLKDENLFSFDELGSLKAGLYFVRVDIDGRIQNCKLVKQ